MAKRPIYKARLIDKRQVTPWMTRVVLADATLRTFPEGQEGSYVKLLLATAESPPIEETEASEVVASQYIKRSYTIVASSAEQGTLEIDMVLHEGERGPATEWALSSEVGDEVFITGPGPVQGLNLAADWFFLAGDEVALPAIIANLKQLPQDARGCLVIEADAPERRLPLSPPSAFQVVWLDRSGDDSGLAAACRAQPWQAGRVSVWGAAEFSAMKQLRAYFVGERKVPREDLYISSYWKHGATDEQHKQAKKLDVG